MTKVFRVAMSIVVIVVLSVVALEMACFGAVYLMARANPSDAPLNTAVSRFHPIFRASDPAATDKMVPIYQRKDAANPFQFDPRHGYAFTPGKRYTVGARIGPQGFICNGACTTMPVVKPANEYRVFVFGGSTVAGSGRDTESIPAFLELALNRRSGGKTVRVVNLGVGGYSSAQEVSSYIHDYAIYEPDLVIFYDGFNDFHAFWYVNFYPFIARYAGYIRPSRVAYDYTLIEGIARVRSPFGAVTHTLNLLNESFPVLFYTATLAKRFRATAAGWTGPADWTAGGKADSGPRPASGVTPEMLVDRHKNSAWTYVHNLKVAASVARGLGAKGLFLLQPTLMDYREIGVPPTKKSLAPDEAAAFRRKSDIREAAQAYYDSVRDLFAEAAQTFNGDDLAFCDLTGVFSDVDASVYTDEVHLNTHGRKLVADRILALVENLRAAPTRRPVCAGAS